MKKLLPTLLFFSILGLMVLSYLKSSGYLQYVYQRVILVNRPTVLFTCDKFGTEAQLNGILTEKKSQELADLETYLSEIGGNIYITEVGRRCPDKYQFTVSFGGNAQRVKIEQILKDQSIEGIPVFLLNR